MQQGEFDFNDDRRPKDTGRTRRDKGMEKALANQHPAVVAWKDAFRAAADALISSDQFFHAEHIRGICGDPPIQAHPNIFGAMMNSIVRLTNYISGTGQCKRKSSHARGLKIYKGARRDED
jgi:hypothetical protein